MSLYCWIHVAVVNFHVALSNLRKNYVAMLNLGVKGHLLGPSLLSNNIDTFENHFYGIGSTYHQHYPIRYNLYNFTKYTLRNAVTHILHPSLHLTVTFPL